MVKPQQSDFKFRSDRVEDEHNHDPDIGTEVRSTAIRDCKVMAREQPFESAGDIVDAALAKLSINPGMKPVDSKNVARCLQRERAGLFPPIDLSNPDYEVRLGSLKGIFLLFFLLLGIYI